MIKKEQEFKAKVVAKVAEEMCVAARTAPKGKGLDLLEIAVVTGADIKKLAQKMLAIGQEQDNKTFLRDSENILQAQAIVLLGTKKKYIGLRYCGFCGFKNCAEAEKVNTTCAFNTNDLGIAVGSAVAVAADQRIDSRVMYTIGKAVLELNWLGPEVIVALGIPLSVSSKNPFFDRS